jgi:hypothetical protein
LYLARVPAGAVICFLTNIIVVAKIAGSAGSGLVQWYAAVKAKERFGYLDVTVFHCISFLAIV